jgi:hypothetical protein
LKPSEQVGLTRILFTDFKKTIKIVCILRIIKKGKTGKGLLSKLDFINYVGDNWKTQFPKLKAKGLVFEKTESALHYLGVHIRENKICEENF